MSKQAKSMTLPGIPDNPVYIADLRIVETISNLAKELSVRCLVADSELIAARAKIANLEHLLANMELLLARKTGGVLNTDQQEGAHR
jgi:hypothetical protein